MELTLSLFELLLIVLITSILTAVLVYFKLKSYFEKKLKQSLNLSRAVIKGNVIEQIAPLLEGFPYRLSELRFIGKPVDFIAFVGLDNNNIEEVVFIEIKSGESKLNKNEQAVKKAIENKRVRWFEFKI